MSRLVCTSPGATNLWIDPILERRSPLSREAALHLESCDACRVEIERRLRFAATWEGLRLGAGELSRARSRVEARRKRGRGVRFVPGGIAFAVVLAAAAASGASRLAILHAPAIASAVSVAFARPMLRARARIERSGAGAEPEALAMPAPIEAEPMTLPVPLPPATAAAVVTPSPLASSRVPARRRTVPSGGEPRPPATAGGWWEIAAAALRDGDWQRAEAAFDTLAGATDARTRDAARLARAELWLAHGRTTDARRELDALATEGATGLVRARASEALRGLR